MTMKDLRKEFKLRFDDAAKIAYMLPQDIIDNTIRAFNASPTSATGYGTLGVPTGRYLAPANNASCIQVYSGQCAPQNVFVTGPKFTRFDLSVKKQVRFSERFNFELRAEFLNAFNNINYFNPLTTATTTPSLAVYASDHGLHRRLKHQRSGRTAGANRQALQLLTSIRRAELRSVIPLAFRLRVANHARSISLAFTCL
ncbi:MAG: hypothetical protein U0X75_16675 [Acidobacteriota bacterium]